MRYRQVMSIREEISFDHDESTTGDQEQENDLLESEMVAEYRKRLMAYVGIWNILLKRTEKTLTELHYDPRLFSLEEDSAKKFLSADLQKFCDGGEEPLFVSFEATIDNILYRTYAAAFSRGGGSIFIDCILMKWDGRQWLAYIDDRWESSSGPDFPCPFPK